AGQLSRADHRAARAGAERVEGAVAPADEEGRAGVLRGAPTAAAWRRLARRAARGRARSRIDARLAGRVGAAARRLRREPRRDQGAARRGQEAAQAQRGARRARTSPVHDPAEEPAPWHAGLVDAEARAPAPDPLALVPNASDDPAGFERDHLVELVQSVEPV